MTEVTPWGVLIGRLPGAQRSQGGILTARSTVMTLSHLRVCLTSLSASVSFRV